MATVVVFTSQTLSSYTQRVQLDGDLYELKIRWNSCAQAWFCDIFNDEGDPVVYGRKCVVDSRLTGQHKHRVDIPVGELTVFDTTQRKLDPGVRELGSRVLLLYHDAAELEGFEGAI